MFMRDKSVYACSAIRFVSVAASAQLLISCLVPRRRPGILVLINDCDWELCGSLRATLEDKDTVVFISTLHGG